MNVKEAEKIYEQLERTEKDIDCIVSSSYFQGNGKIIDAFQERGYIEFGIRLDDGRRIKVPCFGVYIPE